MQTHILYNHFTELSGGCVHMDGCTSGGGLLEGLMSIVADALTQSHNIYQMQQFELT